MSNQVQLQSVTSLKVTINRQFPISLTIEVTGETSHPGFINIHLEKYFYEVPPEDGLYEFSLAGVPPADPEADVITTVTAQPYVWEYLPADLKGVRVHANLNSAEELLFADPVETEGLF